MGGGGRHQHEGRLAQPPGRCPSLTSENRIQIIVRLVGPSIGRPPGILHLAASNTVEQDGDSQRYTLDCKDDVERVLSALDGSG